LAYAPFVLRTQRDPSGMLGLTAHTGATVVDPREALLDERGALLVQAASGVGSIHDQDLPDLMADLIDESGAPLPNDATEPLLAASCDGRPIPGVGLRLGAGVLPLSRIDSAQVARRFGFDPDPRPAPGEPDC